MIKKTKSILLKEQKGTIFSYVNGQFTKGNPVSYDDILDCIYQEFHILMLPDTLRHLIKRSMDYKSIIGIPIEKERAQVTQESINKHFEDLSRNITGIPARFIFNADESGFQDFVDSSEVHVIVPSSYRK